MCLPKVASLLEALARQAILWYSVEAQELMEVSTLSTLKTWRLGRNL
jgi:hypothetical protein